MTRADRVDMSVLDTDFYQTRIRARVNGIAVNPSALSVEFAFRTSHQGDPEDSDYHAGSWDHDGTTWRAIIEVGPLAVPLTTGLYRVFVKIDGKRVKTPGYLNIY